MPGWFAFCMLCVLCLTGCSIMQYSMFSGKNKIYSGETEGLFNKISNFQSVYRCVPPLKGCQPDKAVSPSRHTSDLEQQ